MMITRCGHCPSCEKAGRPLFGQHFIVYGASSSEYWHLIAKRNGKKGFVPTIYKFIKCLGGLVYYQKICTLLDCGSYLAEEDGKIFIYLDEEKWSGVLTMPLKEWNALCGFKNTGLKI